MSVQLQVWARGYQDAKVLCLWKFTTHPAPHQHTKPAPANLKIPIFNVPHNFHSQVSEVSTVCRVLLCVMKVQNMWKVLYSFDGQNIVEYCRLWIFIWRYLIRKSPELCQQFNIRKKWWRKDKYEEVRQSYYFRVVWLKTSRVLAGLEAGCDVSNVMWSNLVMAGTKD